MEKKEKLGPQSVTRRTVVKGIAATGVVAGIGPWILPKKALSSSGEVNVLLWSDYCPPGFIKAFKKKTGITMNFTGIGSNEEIINKMKATKGRGFDV